MPTFNSERLRSARLLSGLSLRQLEEKLNSVSYNAINKYEAGKMQPDPVTILRIAETLNIPVSYFYEGTTIKLGEIEFRKRNSLSAAEINQLKVTTRDKIERYLEAETLLGVESSFENPISRRQVKDLEKAEEMAEVVRVEWGLGSKPIANVIEALEEQQVKVIEVHASDRFDGLSTYVNECIPVAVINENFPVERKRFTVLHELGHLMMNLKIQEEKEKEKACHRFAGALLFPKEEVLRTLGERRRNIAMGELVAIKEEYGISAQAAMRRAFDLNIITASTYRGFCMKMASNRKEEGLGAFKGEEKSYRLKQLVFRLFAEGVITENKAATLLGITSSRFRAEVNNTEELEIKMEYQSTSAFARAWGDDEPDYSDEDLITINPDYESW